MDTVHTLLAELSALAARNNDGTPWCNGAVAGIEASRSLVGQVASILRTKRAALLADGERDYAAGIDYALSLIGGAP